MSDTRLLLITSPLGPGALIATRLSVNETLGLPYSIEVDVLGSDHELLARDLVAKDITVTVARVFDGQPVLRHFHGLVAEFQILGPGAAGRTAYRLVAVPGLWRLSLKRDCRIFQDKTAKDIITAVLQEHEQPSPDWGILPTLQPIPYCTQFNETDLHFVLRLLEEHGLACYFSHSASAHTLHISSTAQGFPAFEGGDENGVVQAAHGEAGHFQLGSWQRSNRARSYCVTLADMDAERSQPSVALSQWKTTQHYTYEPRMWDAGELAPWPGGMSTRPGLDRSMVAIGEVETASETYTAQIQDPRFVAGARMQVSTPKEDGSTSIGQFVATAANHEAVDLSGLTAGASGGEAQSYHGALTMVAASRTWMPLQRHVRPVMAGLHSAKVTGPSGEKIHVDEFGRIKLKFRWDRTGPNDDNSGCWVRVSQPAAGAWGGTWFLPRVGDEVLVAFLDGDPDRPIVTGSVYGKDAKPPFDPQAHRSRSGISTRSYKSDSASDANVLRFEDKKDAEEVLLHAQKDLTVEVENDETRNVDHDQTETIKNARTVTIKDANDTLTLEKGSRTQTLQQGNDTLSIQQGNLSVKCDLGSVTIEAMQSITLKVGQNSVVIDQTGVTVKGGLLQNEATGMSKTKAPLVQINADGCVLVKGGIVTIN